MEKLYEIENIISTVYKTQPNITEVLTGDIYQLNTKPNISYPIGCITQSQHSEDDDWRYYSLYIYYVDRLTENKENQLEIQSHAIEVLHNVIANIESMDIECGNVTYTPFYQSFADLCAGAYAQVTISIPISNCADYLTVVTSVDGESGDIDLSKKYLKADDSEVDNIDITVDEASIYLGNGVSFSDKEEFRGISLDEGQMTLGCNYLVINSDTIQIGDTTLNEEQLKKLLELI